MKYKPNMYRKVNSEWMKDTYIFVVGYTFAM